MDNFFGVIQVGSKFQRELKPGCHYVPCCFGYRIVSHTLMKAQHYVVLVIIKTNGLSNLFMSNFFNFFIFYMHDDVLFTVVVTINIGVLNVADVNNAQNVFYVHNDPKNLIEAHVFDG